MENIILILIIAIAAVYVIKVLYRQIKGRNSDCGCSGCSGSDKSCKLSKE